MGNIDIWAATPEFGGFPYYQWISVHCTALTVICLSCIGSSNIIYLTVQKMRKQPLVLMQLFPMFISCTDLLFGFFHGSDHLASIIQGHVTNGGACLFLGFGTVYSMNIPSFWITTCSFYIYMIVVRNKQVNFGNHDWMLHAFNWGVPMLINLIALGQNEFGPEPAWCGLPTALWIYNAPFLMIGLTLTIGFYTATYWFIMQHRKSMKGKRSGKTNSGHINTSGHLSNSGNLGAARQSGGHLSANNVGPVQQSGQQSGQPQSLDKKLKQAARNLPIFVLIFIIQWIPYAIYAILLGTGRAYYGLNLFVVTVTNSGGIWNAIAYRKLLIRSEKEDAREIKARNPSSNNVIDSTNNLAKGELK